MIISKPRLVERIAFSWPRRPPPDDGDVIMLQATDGSTWFGLVDTGLLVLDATPATWRLDERTSHLEPLLPASWNDVDPTPSMTDDMETTLQGCIGFKLPRYILAPYVGMPVSDSQLRVGVVEQVLGLIKVKVKFQGHDDEHAWYVYPIEVDMLRLPDFPAEVLRLLYALWSQIDFDYARLTPVEQERMSEPTFAAIVQQMRERGVS